MKVLRPVHCVAVALLVGSLMPGVRAISASSQKSPGAGPVVVLETVRGTIEFETYPDEAPKTVARVLELVRKGFYRGLRFHRVEPRFLVQIGDPQTRNMQMKEWWGRAGSGTPIGVAEITRKRRHVRGAVAMAYSMGGDPRQADSQFYIAMRELPDLDAKYTVFGRVISGMGIVERLQKGDLLKTASVKE